MEVVGQALASGSPPASTSDTGPGSQQRSPLAQQAVVLLHKRCKVQVKDGRVLVGDFTCLDKQGNIILANTYEHMQLNGRLHEKQMGQVLVPASHRVSCEFEALPYDRQQLQQLMSSQPA